MADKLWKATERTIARRLNGQRTGATGRSGADVVNGWLSVEVKTRRQLPKWLHEALQQARAGAGEGQLAVAILHQTGDRYDDAVVLIRLRDFEAWFGNLEQCPEGE
ncbi:MAG: hypothetical protein NZ765_07485 [Anaerolineae bacterium]|nr:hypothetical protein [Anaerolineae bacterium]